MVHLANGGRVDGTAKDVLSRIVNRPQDVDFFRFDSSDFAFAWIADVTKDRKHPEIALNECGLISTGTFRADFCRELIFKSATEQLSEDVNQSIDRVALLVSAHGSA